MEKTKKEILAKWLVAVLSALFLTMAFVTQGQNKIELSRLPNYSIGLKRPVVSKFPEEPLLFQSPVNKNDTIFMSIMSDSINENVSTIKLYAYFPKNINAINKSIIIGFEDGKYFTFGQVRFNKDLGYGEYEVNQNCYTQLSHVKYNYVLFDGISQSYARDNKDYFINFLYSYYK